MYVCSIAVRHLLSHPREGGSVLGYLLRLASSSWEGTDASMIPIPLWLRNRRLQDLPRPRDQARAVYVYPVPKTRVLAWARAARFMVFYNQRTKKM